MSKIVVALCLVLASCGLTSTPLANVRLSFTVPTPTTIGRAVFSETALVGIDVTNPGKVNTKFNLTPQLVGGVWKVDAVIALTLGNHTLTASAFDGAGQILSQGSSSLVISSGPNVLTLELLPPLTLKDGASYDLAAGQIAYFQTEVPANALLRVTGTSSSFWTFAPNALPVGGGQAGTLDLLSGPASFVRVLQAAAGTVTAQVIPVVGVTINFDNPSDFQILGLNDPEWDTNIVTTMTVSLSGTTFVSYQWFVDAVDEYSDGEPFTLVGDALQLESEHLSSGWHEVSVVAEDTAGSYFSARFKVEVLR